MDVLKSHPVPIFPLPNVVLYPRVVQPLHIFEPRYREMFTDSFDSYGKIAMALLKPGWEAEYHGEPEVHPVVGAGSIVTYQKREDGTLDVLLVGECRARIVAWVGGKVYRRARLRLLADRSTLSGEGRRRLLLQLRGWMQQLKLGPRRPTGLEEIQELFADDEDPGFLADYLAFRVLDDPREKQLLLEEAVLERRVRGLERLLARRGFV